MAKKVGRDIRTKLKQQTSRYGSRRHGAQVGEQNHDPKPVTLPTLKFMEGPDPEHLGGVRPAADAD